MSSEIMASDALVALYDTAMVSELFSVMGLVLGVPLSQKTAPDDAIYPLLNAGLGKIGTFHSGMGVKQFINIDRWTFASKTGVVKEREIVSSRMLPEIDEYISQLMLEGVNVTDVGIAPLQISPGAFGETPGIVMFNAEGFKPKHFLAPIRLGRLLEMQPALQTERWRLLNGLQDTFGKALPLVTGVEPESMIHYSTHDNRIVVDVRCGHVGNVLDCVFEVDNYILHMQAVCDALDFVGAHRVMTSLESVIPVITLSEEERLTALRKNFPDWGKW